MPDNEDAPKVDEQGNPIELKLGEKPPAHPETVSWTQYVGLKETTRKAEEGLKSEVENLKGQLKGATSAEDAEKLKGEIAEAKTKLEAATEELKTTKEATLTEKRAVLTKKGISEDEVKAMSEEQINGAIKVLETYKPKPDLGGGGGGHELKGSPMELARQAYEKK